MPADRPRAAGPPWYLVRPWVLAALGGALVAWWLASEPTPPVPPTVAAAPPAPPAIVDTLRAEQTLSDLWAVHDLPAEDLPAVVEAGLEVLSWQRLRSGSEVRFRFARSGALDGLDLVLDRDRRLVIRRAGTLFTASIVETPTVRRTRTVAACMDGSLWEAVQEAGEDPTVTLEMAEILAAQVDFYTDVRAGDCFKALLVVDERPDGTYRLAWIDAMTFEADGRPFEAYRFSGDGETFDYYDAAGESLKRMFLRSPLKFARISSRFGMRMHPILRRRRPHNGVDYAAPTGTPVQAAGDGVVASAGRNGGYGLWVQLRHRNGYVTSYAHLSRIASGVRRGAKVRQGQVIGYVGSTGLSTGPHLDYRFMKDGRYVDPLSTDLPTAEPLAPEDLAAFEPVRERLAARLAAVDGSFALPDGVVPLGR